MSWAPTITIFITLMLMVPQLGCSGQAAVRPPMTKTETALGKQPTLRPVAQRDAGGRAQAADSGTGASLPAVIPKVDATPPRSTVTVDAAEFVRFSAGSARLMRASRTALNRMVEMIKGSPKGGVIKIEGHCDRAEKNKAVLSLKRARRVKRYLVRKGVEAERLKAVGYGSTKPVASSDTAGGRQQNRRVDFTFVEETY